MSESRSTQTLLAVLAFVAAAFIVMNRVVDQSPLLEWWPALLLFVVGVLLVLSTVASERARERALAAEQARLADDERAEHQREAAERATDARAKQIQAEKSRLEAVQRAEEFAMIDRMSAEAEASAAPVSENRLHKVEDQAAEDVTLERMGRREAERMDKPAPEPMQALKEHAEEVQAEQQPAAEAETMAVIAATERAAAEEAASEEDLQIATERSSAEMEQANQGPERPVTAAPPDDLTVIEGIGPKMSDALRAAGIDTFAKLSTSSEEVIRAAIQAAGMRFAPSVPTWPEQAGYASSGNWDGLKEFQKKLVSGRKID